MVCHFHSSRCRLPFLKLVLESLEKENKNPYCNKYDKGVDDDDDDEDDQILCRVY